MALSLLQVPIENKGVTYTGGQGDWRKFLTIPNILKEYNPNLYGYSSQDCLSIDRSSMFNVAEFGAMSRDVPHMSSVLIQRIKSDPKVNFKNHWKLITLLIGPNDFCLDICYHDRPESIVDSHETDLLATFRNIRDNMPRTMINVLIPPCKNTINLKMFLISKFLSISALKTIVDFTGKSNECNISNTFECPCLFGIKAVPHHQRFYRIMETWMNKVNEVANRDEFHNHQDFTINVQPFLTKIVFPTTQYHLTDYRYLSSDCFHISQIGHAMVSNALWNNMLEPVGQKSLNWKKEFQELKCPTQQRPYLATKFNS